MLVYQRVPSFDPSPHVAVLSSSAAAAARRFCCSSAWTWRCFEKKKRCPQNMVPEPNQHLWYIHTYIHTIQYNTIQYNTIQYNTIHYIHTYIHYIHTYIHPCIHPCMHALHYITLHYITLHYITLHYITLHYIHTYIYIYMVHIYIYMVHIYILWEDHWQKLCSSFSPCLITRG